MGSKGKYLIVMAININKDDNDMVGNNDLEAAYGSPLRIEAHYDQYI